MLFTDNEWAIELETETLFVFFLNLIKYKEKNALKVLPLLILITEINLQTIRSLKALVFNFKGKKTHTT